MVMLKHLRGNTEGIEIEWEDGSCYHLAWRLLRERCPCAVCAQRQKPSAPTAQPGPLELLPILSSTATGQAESGPVRGVRMQPVGNYAYSVEFSDGHHSGIYSLDFLRALSQEQLRQS